MFACASAPLEVAPTTKRGAAAAPVMESAPAMEAFAATLRVEVEEITRGARAAAAEAAGLRDRLGRSAPIEVVDGLQAELDAAVGGCQAAEEMVHALRSQLGLMRPKVFPGRRARPDALSSLGARMSPGSRTLCRAPRARARTHMR